MSRPRPAGAANGIRSKTPIARSRVGKKRAAEVRHIRRVDDLSAAEVRALIDLAIRLCDERKSGTPHAHLPGRVLGLVFEKPSMRTRVSFECAMAHLGGSCVFLTAKEIGLGERETEADFARVVSGYVDALAIRTFAQERIDELADHAAVPVINALSDSEHPCQALGDLATIKRRLGKLEGARVAFVGDANNVARSLALACARVGVSFTFAGPDGYRFPAEFEAQMRRLGGDFAQTDDPHAAVHGADAVYTDAWTSMGQESEQTIRRRAFANFQVNAALMKRAKKSAIFLHCLPAKRGEEVSADVLDGPRSAVVEQAEFRLHVQKALLWWLLAKSKDGADVLAPFLRP